MSEARILKLELRERVASLMRKLGNTMTETAEAMDVSLRSVYRYASVHEDESCILCNLVHSQDIKCKSDTYTVVYKANQYIVVLNKHRHATLLELKVVECFIDYVFPYSLAEKSGNGHNYWMLNKVELEEATRFENMCNALDRYILSLNGGAKCLQRTG